ncbi:riboflavin biosynthesis RibT protein [Gracilibacillus orientalis]|uniref:Riboflavin biosynthesis RibT protein n=1 Tax=Gracilibacillus orientalis TaxID=334253 RepID=A0A1I4KZU7_9BACI|nr:GNAT family N-acetyltransferase [Gracilibacillus orientalis]SFL84069.1 riboflavin biosynthesis RibT protein [Gracilibacillus orientalis]
MLIRFKKRFEKIAMGLLSFMPEEKEVSKLQDTIKEYETNDVWQLFLWKEEEDVLGAIGVYLDKESETAVVQHITVNPSHRNLGIGKKMVNALKKHYGATYEVLANKQTEKFLQKCNANTDE